MLIQKPRFPIRDILLFGLLPSYLKILIYRLKGYKVGKRVTIGFGSVVCGKEVSIGDYTTIGFLTVVRGDRIRIGSHVSIGSMTILDTPHMEIGDGSKINEQVFLGGLQFPDSRFVMGRNCQIMQMSFINPARSIIIGDDTGIGGDCLLFGHTSWLSLFEGYPVDFAPIEIGNSVSLSWRVFVLPGTRIGDGTVIGANSLVHRTIPPKCLAVGFPARVVSKAPDFPRDVTDEEKLAMLRDILIEMEKYFRGSGLACESLGAFLEVIHRKKKLWRGVSEKTWRLKVEYEPLVESDFSRIGGKMDVLLSLRSIPVVIKRTLNARKIMWIDIERKEQSLFWNDLGEEVVLFLRRYGVRFLRVEA